MKNNITLIGINFYPEDTDEFYIEKTGDALIIKPKPKNNWDNLFDVLDTVDASDFLADRKQPKVNMKKLKVIK